MRGRSTYTHLYEYVSIHKASTYPLQLGNKNWLWNSLLVGFLILKKLSVRVIYGTTFWLLFLILKDFLVSQGL
uniref:Putative ovule protein n=1 Tax=Solanum chacoense TaxID=4108 RepID=A0A0V0HB44_SOLCH